MKTVKHKLNLLKVEKTDKPANFSVLYNTEVAPKLFDIFKYKNKLETIKLDKIVLTTCFSRKKFQPNIVYRGFEILGLVSGALPVFTTISRPIANFSTRSGMKVGAKVTLRNKKMFEFLERLFKIYLPQARLFQGFNRKSVSKSSLSLGIVDCSVFPELDSELSILRLGMTICFSFKRANGTVLNIKSEEIIKFFSLYGFPILS